MWGATQPGASPTWEQNFNPRSPCGERPCMSRRGSIDSIISIHAPRVGSDGLTTCLSRRNSEFQSTLPVWGATGVGAGVGAVRLISIHAPRVGSDRQLIGRQRNRVNFNPRSPCGERPGRPGRPSTGGRHFNPRSPCGERPYLLVYVKCLTCQFQSTLPVWGATPVS